MVTGHKEWLSLSKQDHSRLRTHKHRLSVLPNREYKKRNKCVHLVLYLTHPQAQCSSFQLDLKCVHTYPHSGHGDEACVLTMHNLNDLFCTVLLELCPTRCFLRTNIKYNSNKFLFVKHRKCSFTVCLILLSFSSCYYTGCLLVLIFSLFFFIFSASNLVVSISVFTF